MRIAPTPWRASQGLGAVLGLAVPRAWFIRTAPGSDTEGLGPEEVLHGLPHHLPADIGDGLGERDLLGADFDAVLRVAAFLDAAIAHERLQPVNFQCLAGGMGI